MSPEVVQNFIVSLKIMGQGMEGIFVVIVLISLVVWAMGRIRYRRGRNSGRGTGSPARPFC